MEIPQTTTRPESTKTASAENAGEYSRSAESDVARAIAQIECVLREISPRKVQARGAGRQLKNEERDDGATINSTKAYTHSPATVHFGVFDLDFAKLVPDPLFLDQGLDFLVHEHGHIELSQTGFRRMSQAHSAGRDVVIGVDSRDVLRLPFRNEPCPETEHQRRS
jgi:hypothetical protein